MRSIKNVALLFIIVAALISCGDSSKEKDKTNNASQTVKNASKVVNEAKKTQDEIQQLREITPLTKDQFESWMPETLLDLTKTTTSINLVPGLSSCGINYRKEHRSISVVIIDGAGEKGAGGVGPYRMSSKMDYDKEDEWGYEKSKILNGIKVKESFRKSGDAYTITMFYDNRYAINIKTTKIIQEELEQIVEQLNLDQLSKL